MSSSTHITKILILAANPKDTTKLRLDEEVREILEGLRRSKQRDHFEIESRWAVRSDDLRRAILDFDPQIVHFCGHGEMPLAIVASLGTIFLVSQLPELLRNPSSESNQTPNQTLSSTRDIIPIGWIRIGVINHTSGSLSAGERLLQTSDSRLAPSIDSPVVPSIGAVVTVKNPVNLRQNKQQIYNSDLPEKVGLLQPKEKLIILKLQRLVNSDSNSSRREIWAQVSKCNQTCE